MSDKLEDQMREERMIFAVDFLTVMFHLKYWKGHQVIKQYDKISDFVVLLFLAQWGFSENEFAEIISTSNKLITHDLHDEYEIVIDRMANYLRNDLEGQKKLIIQISAITALNYGVLNCPIGLAEDFQIRFKIPIEEFTLQLAHGVHWFELIDHIGIAYLQSGLKIHEALIDLRKTGLE